MCVQATAYAAELPTFRYISEESAPDNFTENGVLKGVSVEVLHEIWKIMGVSRQPVEVLPWARGYRETLEMPGTVLFATARIPEREALFKWVGPIRTSRFVLIAHRNSKIWISSPQELQDYKIGTVIDDIGEKLLTDLGIPLSKLDRATSSIQNLEKFRKGRFELMPFSESGVSTVLKSQGMNPKNYRVVYTLSEKQIHFAFHKDTPDSTVLKFQQALDTLKKNGTISRILKKYGISPLAAESGKKY
jgi:polar amino acid transport system substrate-binding protein